MIHYSRLGYENKRDLTKFPVKVSKMGDNLVTL